MKYFVSFLLCSFFLISTATSQSFNWINQAKTGGNNYLRGFVELDGYIYVTGRQRGVSEYGYGSNFLNNNTHFGSRDIIVLKIHKASGKLIKYGHFGSQYSESGMEVITDGKSIYIFGRYVNGLKMGQDSIVGLGSEDVYIAKLDTALDCKWLRGLGSKAFDDVGDIVCESGIIYGSVSYAGDTLQTNGFSVFGGNTAIFSLDTGGVFNWVTSNLNISAKPTSSIYDITYDPESDEFFFCGKAAYTQSFSGLSLNAFNNQWGDMMYGSFDKSGVFKSIGVTGSSYPEEFRTAAVKDGYYWFGGYFSGLSPLFSTTLRAQSSFSGNPDALSKRNAFVTRYDPKTENNITFQFRSTKYSDIHSIKFDKNDALWVLGSFSDTLFINDTLYSSTGDADCFLVSLTKELNVASIIVFGGPNSWDGGGGGDKGSHLSIDDSNNVMLSAEFIGRFNRDGLSLVPRVQRGYYGVMALLKQEANAAFFQANTDSICVDSVVTYVAPTFGKSTSYSWSFPGGNPQTSNKKEVQVAYSKVGQYDVELKLFSDIGDDSVLKVNYISVVGDCKISGLSNFPPLTIDVFPNPANTHMKIKLSKKTEFPLAIQLISMSGTVCLEQELDSSGIINIEHLNNGIYVLKVSNERYGIMTDIIQVQR